MQASQFYLSYRDYFLVETCNFKNKLQSAQRSQVNERNGFNFGCKSESAVIL